MDRDEYVAELLEEWVSLWKYRRDAGPWEKGALWGVERALGLLLVGRGERPEYRAAIGALAEERGFINKGWEVVR